MEQPLDFSKPSISSQSSMPKSSLSSFAMKKQISRSNVKPIKNLSNEYQLHNSENSDETQSRSSASSPDSLQNERATLNLNSATLSQQALLMLAAVSNPNLAAINYNTQQLIGNSDLNSNFIDQLTSFTSNGDFKLNPNVINNQQTMNHQKNLFLQSQNSSRSEMMSRSQFEPFAQHSIKSNHHEIAQTSNKTDAQAYNYLPASGRSSKHSNQTKSSTKTLSDNKAVSRKSIIFAMQEQDEQKSTISSNQPQSCVNSSASKKFGILSNSQNSNILHIDADNESDISNSPLASNSLQISINSNMSSEENSIYGDFFSQDSCSPKSQRRRGNPIPESLKDDSYWVRRRKNNEAAKKSRDAKRSKDLITAKRAVLLENENSQLKSQLNKIRNENLILRTFLSEEVFGEDKHQIDELISASRQISPEKIRSFAQAIFGESLHNSQNAHSSTNFERMES